MQRLTQREVRFLCWKVKQGQRLDDRQAFALLNELMLKEAAQKRQVRATNDNLFSTCFGCQERNTLFRRYNQLVKHYMGKTVLLNKHAGRKSPEYMAIWRDALETRLRVAEARSEYQQHMGEHGC